MKLIALSAGLSQPSSTRLLADRMSAATGAALRSAGHDIEITPVELRDYAHDIVDNMLTGFGSPRLEELKAQLVAADGVVATTPIFSQSFSGLFKSFLDVIDQKSLVNKPVYLGATAGTARHSLALEFAVRPVFAYLKALVSPTAVFAASEDWGGADGISDELDARIARGAQEFATLLVGSALEATRELDDLQTPDFEDLLRAGGVEF
ncbi:CE1759 family FMN reductase [Populibacterium corticicola]|uniref:CE1759 family FMN reductase n=1 Tax=Populibacterium corticicola TaxID=1812826 RepID=A0ABW5XEB8_9MICO